MACLPSPTTRTGHVPRCQEAIAILQEWHHRCLDVQGICWYNSHIFCKVCFLNASQITSRLTGTGMQSTTSLSIYHRHESSNRRLLWCEWSIVLFCISLHGFQYYWRSTADSRRHYRSHLAFQLYHFWYYQKIWRLPLSSIHDLGLNMGSNFPLDLCHLQFLWLYALRDGFLEPVIWGVCGNHLLQYGLPLLRFFVGSHADMTYSQRRRIDYWRIWELRPYWWIYECHGCFAILFHRLCARASRLRHLVRAMDSWSAWWLCLSCKLSTRWWPPDLLMIHPDDS